MARFLLGLASWPRLCPPARVFPASWARLPPSPLLLLRAAPPPPLSPSGRSLSCRASAAVVVPLRRGLEWRCSVFCLVFGCFCGFVVGFRLRFCVCLSNPLACAVGRRSVVRRRRLCLTDVGGLVPYAASGAAARAVFAWAGPCATLYISPASPLWWPSSWSGHRRGGVPAL